jgi:hypothetical protein
MKKRQIEKINNINFIARVHKYRDEHPNFRVFLDLYTEVSNKMALVYGIMTIGFISMSVYLSYLTLPEDIRNITTPIFGFVLSSIIVPIYLSYLNRKKENEFKRFENNKKLYYELSKIIVDLICKDVYTDYDLKLIEEYIVKNYNQMCISFDSELIWYIYSMYHECKLNCTDNLRTYAKKCIKTIRNESGNKKSFGFYYSIFEILRENSMENEEKKKFVIVCDNRESD